MVWTNTKAVKPGMKLNIPDASDQAAKKTRVQAAKTREQVTRAPVREQAAAREPAREQVTRYTVRQGDTIYSLSKRFGVTADSLKGWNKIKGTELRAGDNIKVYQ
jgi:FOG: LysM repeat